MMQNLFKNWYVIYTRPRCERRVAEQLGRRKIEHYLPQTMAQRLWFDWRRLNMEPLFTSYVFVYITEAEQMRVSQLDGVASFMYWLGKPAVIRPEEINGIKNFLQGFSGVYAEKTQVNLDEHLRILGSPKVSREGNIVEVRATTTVKVTLPSLGYILVADLKRNIPDSISHITKLETIVR